MTTFYILQVLLISFLAGSATFLGVFIGNIKRLKKRVAFGASFAAGIMILISVFELIPAAYGELNLIVFGFTLMAGGLAIYLSHFIIPHAHSVEGMESGFSKKTEFLFYLITVGIVLHDFPEGFAIPSSFSHSSSLGILMAASIFIHNIPEGYALSCVSRNDKKNIFFYKSALFSSLSTMSGAVLGLILLDQIFFINPILLAFAAGAMLYVSLHELIPFSEKHKHGQDIFFGFAFSVVLYYLLNLLA